MGDSSGNHPAVAAAAASSAAAPAVGGGCGGGARRKVSFCSSAELICTDPAATASSRAPLSQKTSVPLESREAAPRLPKDAAEPPEDAEDGAHLLRQAGSFKRVRVLLQAEMLAMASPLEDPAEASAATTADAVEAPPQIDQIDYGDRESV